MAHISIIGTGNKDHAISTALAKGGHTVDSIDHGEADKPVNGEIVVLAVPIRPWPKSPPPEPISWLAESSWTSPTR